MEYPIHARSILTSDPAILADPVTKKYYMTSSGFTIDGKPVRGFGKIFSLVSEDLVHWSEPQIIFDSTLYPDFWGKTGYPAVEMHYLLGKYYLATTSTPQYSTLHPMIVCADNPLGPFRPLSNEPYGPRDWDMLDCTLYVDEENHPWLIYSHLWYEVSDGQMLLQSLSDDFSRTTHGPMILFRGSDAAWSDDQIWSKTDGGGVAEAPFLYRSDEGELWMLWTGRSRTGYCLGYAKSETGKIWGPWKQMERPPAFTATEVPFTVTAAEAAPASAPQRRTAVRRFIAVSPRRARPRPKRRRRAFRWGCRRRGPWRGRRRP